MLEKDVNSFMQNELGNFLTAFSPGIVEKLSYQGSDTVVIKSQIVREAMLYLKQELGFNTLIDLFGMDYLKMCPPEGTRFAVVYNLRSIPGTRQLMIKTYLDSEIPEVDSIHDIFAAANWFEREAWDLFGIRFEGHPKLIRILCHQDFVGHPLRKDYPSDKYQVCKRSAKASDL